MFVGTAAATNCRSLETDAQSRNVSQKGCLSAPTTYAEFDQNALNLMVLTQIIEYLHCSGPATSSCLRNFPSLPMHRRSSTLLNHCGMLNDSVFSITKNFAAGRVGRKISSLTFSFKEFQYKQFLPVPLSFSRVAGVMYQTATLESAASPALTLRITCESETKVNEVKEILKRKPHVVLHRSPAVRCMNSSSLRWTYLPRTFIWHTG